MKNSVNKGFFAILLLITFKSLAQEFTKGKLLYSNSLATSEKVNDWILEGPAKIEFKKFQLK